MNIYFNIAYPLYYFNLCILIVVLSSCEINQIETKNDKGQVVDSISEWMQIAKNNEIDDKKRI